MRKYAANFGLASLGCAITMAALALPLLAHKQQRTADVEVMIHLEPDDSPYAKKPSLTWFMLMRHSGEMIAPANCDCRVVAYNAQNTPIAQNLPLSAMPIKGHGADHQAIRTTITFPQPGAYKVKLSGQSRDGSFRPFELTFPVTVRP